MGDVASQDHTSGRRVAEEDRRRKAFGIVLGVGAGLFVDSIFFVWLGPIELQ